MTQGSPSSALGATSSRAGPTAPPISSILPLLSSTFFTGFSAISYISGILRTISHLLLVAIPGHHLCRPLPPFPNHYLLTNPFRHFRWHTISRRRVCPASPVSGLRLHWSRMSYWDSYWPRGTSSRQFRWVGTAWRGGPTDDSERFSLANTTAEEVVDFPGKEEGHFEDRGLNLTEFVRDPRFSLT
jgi:hypothetical protein